MQQQHNFKMEELTLKLEIAKLYRSKKKIKKLEKAGKELIEGKK
jgi:hypothetical protein